MNTPRSIDRGVFVCSLVQRCLKPPALNPAEVLLKEYGNILVQITWWLCLNCRADRLYDRRAIA
jgi:hypothetical protein